MKKLIKLAIIRRDEENSCPFGLDIDYACKNAGNSVDEMHSSDNLTQDQINANKKIFLLKKDNTPCKYAAAFFDQKHNAVNCLFPNPSAEIPSLNPSEFYSKMYGYTGFEGAQSYPMEYYEGWLGEKDNDNTLNPYYGIYQMAQRKQRLQKRMEKLNKLKNKL